MAKSGAHRESAAWQPALNLLEKVHRLAQSLPVPEGERLAESLVRAAAPITALAIRAATGDGSAGAKLEAALIETEALAQVSVRLGYLRDHNLAQVLRALDELRAIPLRLPPAGPAGPAGAKPSLATRGQEPTTPARAEAPSTPSDRPRPTPAAAPASRRAEPSAPPSEPDRLFVDGCNFLGRAPGYDLGDPASRDRLLFRLQEYAHEHPAHRVVVFFDGQRASSQVTAGVEERITSGMHNADDVMIDHIRALPAGERRRCTLVTDDRDLAARARREGVRAESVQWLISKFVGRRPAGNPRAGLSKSELSEWEQFFSQPPKRPGK